MPDWQSRRNFVVYSRWGVGTDVPTKEFYYTWVNLIAFRSWKSYVEVPRKLQTQNEKYFRRGAKNGGGEGEEGGREKRRRYDVDSPFSNKSWLIILKLNYESGNLQKCFEVVNYNMGVSHDQETIIQFEKPGQIFAFKQQIPTRTWGLF